MNRPGTDIRPNWLSDTVWPWHIHSLPTSRGPVAYTDTGSGPTVLLVHAGMWSMVWRDLIADLAPDHRCITLDAPGNGLSERDNPDDIGIGPAADAVGELIDALDLRDVTLVIHDLGGSAALAGVATRTDRVARIVAVNTFAWRPTTALLKIGLAFMGSAFMREIDAISGWMPRLTATGAGVARHWDRETRVAFLRGMGPSGRRALHRYFADGRRSPAMRDAERALDSLADRPVTTVFGRRNDYFGFQPQWRQRFPDARQYEIEDGNHFPMCDDPGAVGRLIREAETSL